MGYNIKTSDDNFILKPYNNLLLIAGADFFSVTEQCFDYSLFKIGLN